MKEDPAPAKATAPPGPAPAEAKMRQEHDRSLVVRNLQRRHKVDRRALHAFLRDVAETLDASERSATVALVGDARIRQLNLEFRGFDEPTDVLSFAAGERDYLGDIVISVETALRQAKRRGSHLKRELKVLTLHGFLHLLGYDHETDDGAMRRIEYRLRRRFGITTPRASGST